MKKKTRNILLGLVILSLLFIGGVVTTGFLKYKSENKEKPQAEKNNVLGETTAFITTVPETAENVNRLIQNSLQNTKDVVSQKVIEVEKTIINTINKEIGNMTQTQVDNLKWQICRDLGVVSASPTP